VSEAVLNHLWQSTLFAGAAVLLMRAFRSNAASIRFKIVLAASLKFLLPFSCLILLGEHLPWVTTPAAGASPQWSLAVNQIMQPASLVKLGFGPAAAGTATSDAAMSRVMASEATAPETTVSGATAAYHWSATRYWAVGASALLVWCIGCVVLLGRCLLQWIKLRAIVAAAAPLDIEAPIPVRETTTLLEPGVCGIFAPVLLLPQGITTQLTSTELDSILDHELSHWWRRDNLTAALHMLVEALFWFHPLVWWLGSRLVIERERACDEEVIRSGTDRQVYAEGILKVCRLYVKPPLLCVAGVSSGTLRQRIEDIMTHQASTRLNFFKTALLSAAGFAAIVGPMAVGLALGPQGLAQAQTAGGSSGPATRHYQNREWSFGLDIPGGWNRFPPNPGQSSNEVMRFGSGANGRNGLSIYRSFFDTQKGFGAYVAAHQEYLQKIDKGNANFRTGQATLGSRQVATLEYDRPTVDGGGTLSFRQYFFIEGSLLYLLSFSTTSNPNALIPQQDGIAQSFTFDAST
jgi:beta-lactamase regulating signal transducer with metallopeptidase domain